MVRRRGRPRPTRRRAGGRTPRRAGSRERRAARRDGVGDSGDAKLAGAVLVGPDRVGVGVTGQHLVHLGGIQPGGGRHRSQRARLENGLLAAEMRPVQGVEHRVLGVPARGQVGQPVRVERVAVPAVRAEREPFGGGQPGHPLLGRLGLRRAHPVLLAEHVADRHLLAGREVRVELERPVHHLDLVAVRETGQRVAEPGPAQVTPRADQVAPHLHLHDMPSSVPACCRGDAAFS